MSSQHYVLAYDIGTTTIKASIVDVNDLEPIAISSVKAVINYPRKG